MGWKPDYITLVQAKAYLRANAIGDDLDDAEIAVQITTASRAVDDHCNRQFGRLDAPAQWAYTAEYDVERGLWVVPIDDVTDATGFAVSVDGVGTIDGYTLEPVDAVAKGKAWTRLVVKSTSTSQPTGAANEVLVTDRFGWTVTPTQVPAAVRLQLNRFNARRNAPFGVAGSPQQGSEIRLLSKLDPDVAVSLRGLRRPRRTG